ncbi:MAG TPA: hypothetical protein VI320_40355 [Terracidiphilus sp.]|jgi:hypothetical protein
MEHRSSLWRSFRLLLTLGVAGKSAREDWTTIRQVSYWGNSRRFRRIVVLLWIGLLAVDPWMIVRLSQGFAFLAKLPVLLLPTVTQLLITWLAFRSMCIGLAQPTIEDSALLHFGVAFDALSNRQREELFQRRFRNFIFGRLHIDEREAELRQRAEVAAYRLLRPGLAVVGAVYWAICLLGPFEPVRGTLIVTAVTYTWLAVAILVLPAMIRMWTQPNEAGETSIVSTKNDA